MLVLPLSHLVSTALLPECAGTHQCADFCAGLCAFPGSGRGAHNATVYRITPREVAASLAHKNSGDAPGDIAFFLSRVNLPQLCRADPSYKGCNANGTADESDNLAVEAVVEWTGDWGPYNECNPSDRANVSAPWSCKPSFQYGDKTACVACAAALRDVGREELLPVFGNQSTPKVRALSSSVTLFDLI